MRGVSFSAQIMSAYISIRSKVHITGMSKSSSLWCAMGCQNRFLPPLIELKPSPLKGEISLQNGPLFLWASFSFFLFAVLLKYICRKFAVQKKSVFLQVLEFHFENRKGSHKPCRNSQITVCGYQIPAAFAP